MVFGFAGMKKALQAASKEVKADYAENKDFLEAVCAVTALVALADGELEADERERAKRVISTHSSLSKIYRQDDIDKTMEDMLKRADSFSGRAQLMRELDDVKSKPQLAEDCYLIGLDIAHADGELEESEAKVLKSIAERMSVDLRKLGLVA